MPAAVSSGGSFEASAAPGGVVALLSVADRELVDRLRAGDERAFLGLVE